MTTGQYLVSDWIQSRLGKEDYASLVQAINCALEDSKREGLTEAAALVDPTGKPRDTDIQRTTHEVMEVIRRHILLLRDTKTLR